MEAKFVVVSLQDTKFTTNELAEFIYNHTGRLPSRLEGLVIDWHINTEAERAIHISIGGKMYVAVPASPHYKEDREQLCQFWLDNPYELAVLDVKRVIALGLTSLYKKKILAVWDR